MRKRAPGMALREFPAARGGNPGILRAPEDLDRTAQFPVAGLHFVGIARIHLRIWR